MKRTRERLQDILDAIAQIEKHSKGGRASFDTSELIQIWMVHHLEIIGEAVRAIDPTFETNIRRFRGGLSRACETSSFTTTETSILRSSGPQSKIMCQA